MQQISIGGVWHDKVYGGEVPGPIWRDMMSGALTGRPAPGFHLIDIPDPAKSREPERDRGDGGGRNDDKPGNGGLIGGLIGGGAGDAGGAGGGGGGDGGTDDPGTSPTFSLPEGFIQGNDNGGGRGNGNGGGIWP
jgi:hypothetical protein